MRVFAPSDEDALFALQADAEAAKFLSRSIRTKSEVRQTIARRALRRELDKPGDGLVLAITTRTGATFIGECSLWLRDDRQAKIGFAVAPAHQGRGYAREAAAGLIAFAQSINLADVVYAKVREENVTSVRLLRRLGMTRRALPEGDGEHSIYELETPPS